MFRSLRARWILASVLWTSGLLLLMHIISLVVIHLAPSLRGIHTPSGVIAALALMLAGFIVGRASLALFQPIRTKLVAIRRGDTNRVDGQYPSEVQPLIDDLNRLLAEREKAVERAQRTAADLAHELKTPLALLMQESERIAAAGNHDLADSITHHVERMSRQVNYHLARARATASGTRGAAPSTLAPCGEALLRTMSRLHSARTLTLTCAIPQDTQVRVQRQDLDEMLGNLLDNACKWARAQVALGATQSAAAIQIAVDDDGPGLPPELRAKVLERGVRADQSTSGSGLGLAIVRDLAELYGATLALDGSPLGGLRATLTFPRQD